MNERITAIATSCVCFENSIMELNYMVLKYVIFISNDNVMNPIVLPVTNNDLDMYVHMLFCDS